MDHDSWGVHRRGDRYARHMLTIASSGIARATLPVVAFGCLDATVVVLWQELADLGVLPFSLPNFGDSPFALSGFVLSLLLVFRTDSGYARYSEAIKAWETLLGLCRDLTRQSMLFVGKEMGDEKRAVECARLVKALPASLLGMLRGWNLERLRQVLVQAGLTPAEAEVVSRADHPAQFVVEALCELILDSGVDKQTKLLLEGNLTVVSEQFAACERILKTPVPIFYSHHISRFVTIWLALLPLGLYRTLGWEVIPAMAVIVFTLVGIDEIGLTIEEPFGVLPLETITTTIWRNVDNSVARGLRGGPSALKQIQTADPDGASTAYRASDCTEGLAKCFAGEDDASQTARALEL